MNVKPQASSHSSLVIQSNLALFKPAVRSSNYNQYTAASKAVDGDVTSRKLSGNAATRASDKNPYWRVDLQGTYLVQTVDFFSRLDCCLDMMETIEVRVGK